MILSTVCIGKPERTILDWIGCSRKHTAKSEIIDCERYQWDFDLLQVFPTTNILASRLLAESISFGEFPEFCLGIFMQDLVNKGILPCERYRVELG